MRSLLAKSGITVVILFSLSASLAWASTSSKPGMFLYPLKQTTQKASQVLKNIPTVEFRLIAVTPPPVATEDDQAADPTPEPTFTSAATSTPTTTATSTPTATSTATRAPAPVKAVDKVSPTATTGADPELTVANTITPSLDPPTQALNGVSLISSDNHDDQAAQQKDETPGDSDDSHRPSDDAGKGDSESHESESGSSEHD